MGQERARKCSINLSHKDQSYISLCNKDLKQIHCGLGAIHLSQTTNVKRDHSTIPEHLSLWNAAKYKVALSSSAVAQVEKQCIPPQVQTCKMCTTNFHFCIFFDGVLSIASLVKHTTQLCTKTLCIVKQKIHWNLCHKNGNGTKWNMHPLTLRQANLPK